ncbi:hypothetical protein FBU30_008275 [Linnemannia zychae]|nr:hypothetical protein FBU30_008275 [Linnemannia zychae]
MNSTRNGIDNAFIDQKQKPPIEQVLDITELWSNVLAYLHPKQIRRLRLVSRRFYQACASFIHMNMMLASQKHAEVVWEQDFPSKLVRSLCITTVDQFTPALRRLLDQCLNITTLDINVFGLDIEFLQELLGYCPQHLKSLVIRSEGFVPLESIVETLLQSNAVILKIQSLTLVIGTTGLFETDALSWNKFRSLLDNCISLTSLSLSAVKVMDIPESLEEIDSLHATKAMFPNLIALTMTLCDVSSVGRIRLLRMCPNLRLLDISCRNDVFLPDSIVDHDLLCQLRHIRVSSRSQSYQEVLFKILGHLYHLEVVNFTGLAVQGARLLELADEWSRHKITLRQLMLNPKYHKLTEEELEQVLLQPCFSKLEVLDALCGPDLILRFWNQETQQSKLPFLKTLRALHMRKEDVVSDLNEKSMEVLNKTLKQLPRLVDLTIGTKLEDFGVFQGMGRDPGAPFPDLRTVVYSGPGAVNWSAERPFLQTLVIGCSTEFFNYRMSDIPRQVGRRFRFLEDFKFT